MICCVIILALSPMIAVSERYIIHEESTFTTENPITSQAYKFYSRKPMVGNSVLDSLFEINAEEIQRKKSEHDVENPVPIANEIEHYLPKFLSNFTTFFDPNDVFNPDQLKGFLDNVRSDAWTEFKTMITQYMGILNTKEQSESLVDTQTLNLIQKFLDLGDKVNFVHVFGKKVDHKLLEYLIQKTQSLMYKVPKIQFFSTLFKHGEYLPLPFYEILRSAALKSMQQFAQYILRTIEPHVPEEEILMYYDSLKKKNPIAASGLKLILQLSTDEPMKRDISGLNRFGDYDQGGYGGYGGYGASDGSYGHGGGGYSQGLMLDPYLILGGIGAAALLAFIAYRVIVTTMRRKRSASDFEFEFMYESDMPLIMNYIYKMIEGGEARYDGDEGATDLAQDYLIEKINEMWHQHEDTEGCVRCGLFRYLNNQLPTNINHIDSIIAAGVAHILGSEESGQLLDEVMDKVVLQGNNLICEQKERTCQIEIANQRLNRRSNNAIVMPS